MVDNRSVRALLVCVGALLACKGTNKSPSEEPPAKPLVTSTGPVAGTEIAFTDSVPKPGTKATATRRTTTKFTFQGKVFRESSSLDAVVEVQSSDQFRVTKAALHFKDYHTIKQEGAGTEKKSVSPLAGSRYIVTRADDGKLSGLDDGGSKVPQSQMKLITDDFGSVFTKNTTGAFLPDRPVKIGEKLTPSSADVLKMLEIKDDGKTLIDGTEFILQSASPERASFDVTMTMTQKLVAGMRLRAKMKGKIDIKPSGTWLLAVDLRGPLTLIDASGSEKGTGDVSVSATQSFD